MQEKLEPMCEWNPLLYSNKKKYIWYGQCIEERQNALNLFVKLCQLKIYIHGFVSDFSTYVGLRIFNKKVLDVRDIDRKDSVIFSSHNDGNDMEPLYVLNDKIYESKCVVYGAGVNGEIVKNLLNKEKVDILFFVDSNLKLEGKKVGDSIIYGPDKLSALDPNTFVIEASDHYSEIDQIIENKYKYLRRFYYSKAKFTIGSERWIDNKKSINVFEILTMTQMISDKSVFVYGTDAKARELAVYFILLDFNFKGFLCDISEKQTEILDGYNVLYTEEILYENNYFVFIDKKRKNNIKKLEEMGLCFAKDFGCMYPLCYDALYKRKTRLDIILGHTFVGKCMYPGFCMNGTGKGYKIVTLGGSTTDGSLYPFRSWPELLYRKCDKELTIYNGGVGGYLVSHELLKLIRDVLVLKPDMVITYSGFNDTVHLPFDFEYSNKVYEMAANVLDESWNIENLEQGESVVQSGLKREGDKFDLWLTTIKIMNAVCRENGICFNAFLQPMLASKLRDRNDEEIFLQCWPAYICNRENDMKFFREQCAARKIESHYDYIFDLSHIFDYTTDVYMDHCHVFEKGNDIIADEILKRIYSSISG